MGGLDRFFKRNENQEHDKAATQKERDTLNEPDYKPGWYDRRGYVFRDILDEAMIERKLRRVRLELARGEISEERGTPWDYERKEAEKERQSWLLEETKDDEKKKKNDEEWEKRLKRCKRFYKSHEEKKIVEEDIKAEKESAGNMQLQRKRERDSKLVEKWEAEEKRWMDELDLANSKRTNMSFRMPSDYFPYKDDNILNVHRTKCMPSLGNPHSRGGYCEDCKDDLGQDISEETVGCGVLDWLRMSNCKVQ